MSVDAMPVLYTIGHGRSLKPEDILRLVEEHEPHACPIVIDVRDSRVSRRNRAFDFDGGQHSDRSGTIIPGCRYVWFRCLGNPSRKLPWVPGEEVEEDLALVARAIRRVVDTIYSGPIVLLCSETDYRRCHRRDVAAELVKRVPGLKVVHL